MSRPPITKAMVFAAGRGSRMRPLTDQTPKPLVEVRGRRLIEWHLLQLAAAGVQDVVINTAWLWEQFEPALGDGSRYGLRIRYSHEQRDFGTQLAARGDVALETAGGIVRALPMLANHTDDVFWVVNSDIWAPQCPIFEPNHPGVAAFWASDATKNIAHIGLVPNPAHWPNGNFLFHADSGRVHLDASGPGLQRLTYCGMGVYRAKMFSGMEWGNPQGVSAPLNRLMFAAAEAGTLSGSFVGTEWADIGTLAALAAVNQSSDAAGPSGSSV